MTTPHISEVRTTDTIDTSAGRDAAPHRQVIDLSNERGLSFHRLALIELRKAVDTRSGRWMLIAMAAIVTAVCLSLAIWGTGEDMAFSSFLGLSLLPLSLLLPIVGIMSATQEWTQRTGLTTFTLEPRRGRVVAAKLVAALILTAALLGITAVAAALATLISGGDFTLTGLSVGGVVLAMAIIALQGVGFGLALLNTPLAVVGIFVIPTAWTILTSSFTVFEKVAPWLDLQLVTEPLTAGTMTGENWGQLATASGFWVLLPIAIGTWRVLRREVA